MEQNPTRIDLKKKGEIVLIKVSNEWRPFKIISFDTANRKVIGVWILTDREDKVNGGTPSLPIDSDWINKYLKILDEEQKRIVKTTSYLSSLNRELKKAKGNWNYE